MRQVMLCNKPLDDHMMKRLHVGCLARFFAHALLGSLRQDLIGLPKIAERMTTPLGIGNASPQAFTRFLAMVTNNERNNLARATTQSGPEPAFVGFSADKRPHFIQFQHIVGLCRRQCSPQGG